MSLWPLVAAYGVGGSISERPPTVVVCREREGSHATSSEVAILQYAFPEHIKDVSLGPWHPVSVEYLRNHAGDDHFDASDHRSRHPDGRIGSDPSLANPGDGQRLLETAAAELLEDYRAFLEEE